MAFLSAVATGLVLFYLSVVSDASRWLKMWTPLASHAWISFVCIGVGFYLIRVAAQGVLSMACRNAIGKWFDLRRGMALSLSGVFTSLGFSMAPRWLNQLVESQGYQMAWGWMGLLTLLVMAPVSWLFFRDSLEECIL